MAWGIDFTADVFISSVSFNSVEQINDLIEELSTEIEEQRRLLNMYVVGDITKTIQTDGNVIYEVDVIMTNILDIITENTTKIYKLQLYKDYIQYLPEKQDEDYCRFCDNGNRLLGGKVCKHCDRTKE